MVMLNFGMLPPEVISGRMYSGPGSGPMMAAAAVWDALTSQLDSYAVGYSSVITELQGQVWAGAASQAMVAAAAPFVAWATTTATLTQQAASQARAAAAAYETAFAATVPPAVVAANRTELATLVATNFFGQNTPLIAATEAAYAQMWAQDAAAMYGYATAASAATQLTPFHEPPTTTNSATQSAQSAAQAAGTSVAGHIAGHSHAAVSQLISTVPQHLSALSAAEPSDPVASLSSPMLSGVGAFNTLVRPLILAMQTWRTFGNIGSYTLALASTSGAPAAEVPPAAAAAEFGPGAAGAPGAVLVSMGEAAPVGKLSVPPSWPATTAAIDRAIPPTQLPATRHRGFSPRVARPAMNGRHAVPPTGIGPMHGIAPRRTGTPVFRMRDRRFRIPRPAVGG